MNDSLRTEEERWLLGNQRHLQHELQRIKQTLLHARSRQSAQTPEAPPTSQSESQHAAVLAQLADELPAPPALTSLESTFALTPFERDILLLCAGCELDPTLRSLCRKLAGTPLPTFALALSVLAEPHFSALLPERPLRKAQLIALTSEESLTHSPLRMDERILHHLLGTSSLDHRLTAVGKLLSSQPTPLPTALYTLAEQLCLLIGQHVDPAEQSTPVLSLFGTDSEDRQSIVQAACAELGLTVFQVRAADLPVNPAERAQLLRLCAREQRLLPLAVLLCFDEHDAPESIRSALAWLEQLPGTVLCSSPTPLRSGQRRRVNLEIPPLGITERAEQLRLLLAEDAEELTAHKGPGGADFLTELAQHFHLRREGLASACLLAQGSTEELPTALWHACRSQARPHLDDLARRIEPKVTWDDLILPAPQLHQLRQLVAQKRHQATVYLDWQMAGKSQRGLGVTALFVGQSGTGKTLAAEALAHELRLDLYHIDLSQMVSKYIGETEKNLRRVFDAAEEGGAVLLFDEADALFGKRSEIKDSHDRYANIEVSYLLQRMESYQGISLLTSNLRSALDPAFLRRLRFIIQFPFPDAPQRAALWQRAFPPTTPTEGLALDKLMRLSVTGGQIRNIALCAAFLAVSQQQPVRMQHILEAARSEYEKSERPLAEPEVRGWL